MVVGLGIICCTSTLGNPCLGPDPFLRLDMMVKSGSKMHKNNEWLRDLEKCPWMGRVGWGEAGAREDFFADIFLP